MVFPIKSIPVSDWRPYLQECSCSFGILRYAIPSGAPVSIMNVVLISFWCYAPTQFGCWILHVQITLCGLSVSLIHHVWCIMIIFFSRYAGWPSHHRPWMLYFWEKYGILFCYECLWEENKINDTAGGFSITNENQWLLESASFYEHRNRYILTRPC